MYKYPDTYVLETINLDGGAYSLAYSDRCEELFEEGYCLRFYPGERDVDAWSREHETSIEFSKLGDALGELESFPASDHASLADWLRELV